jgi:hypothetical protein
VPNPTVVSSTTITATTPAHVAGLVGVNVKNVDGQASTLANAFRYLPPPGIAAVSPVKGSLLGGTAVVISGSGFQAGASVSFDGVAATVTSVAAGTIRVTSPAHALGPVSVSVFNPDGQSASTPGAYTYVPANPAGLTATGGLRQIALAWSAAAGASGYSVLRATTAAGPFTAIGTASTTAFTDTGLADGAHWFYVVEATSAFGASGDSNKANATTIPAAPAAVTATAGVKQVALSWAASVGANGYTVLRATVSGGPYTTVGSPATTTFTNTGLKTGTTYFYVVRARNAAGSSANSSEVTAKAL